MKNSTNQAFKINYMLCSLLAKYKGEQKNMEVAGSILNGKTNKEYLL